MKRLIITLILFSFLTHNFAQNFEATWVGLFSYVSVTDITAGNDKLYAAAENAVFTYDLSTQEINTLSTINGLSGEEITTIHYSEINQILVIGYKSGLFDIIMDEEENVLHVVDILEKQTIPPNKKKINQFYEYNDLLYIATEYGISVYDLAALEFGDTYFIGPNGSQINVSQTIINEPYIYAATKENGIKRAVLGNDLINFNNWNNTAGGGYVGIVKVGNNLYTAGNNNVIYSINSNGNISQIGVATSPVIDFQSHNNLLTITTQTNITTYDENFQTIASTNTVAGYELDLKSGLSFENYQYLGTTEDGLLIVPFNSNQAQQVLPDGPINNRPFTLDATPDNLWVAYGDVSATYNPYPLTQIGVSNLKEGTWTNIPYDQLLDANDLVKVRINPQNPDEVFITSFQKGLLKFENQQPVILYNETNSPLNIPNGDPAIGIRLYGLDFDPQGNLWMVQSRTNEGLIKISSTGQFQLFDLSEIVEAENNLALSDLAISREGYVFLGAVGDGLLGFDPNGNRLNIVDDNSGGLPSTSIRTLTFDNNNTLYIGTLKGLRVLYNPTGFFEDANSVEVKPIIINDTEVDAGQELLFQQSVTAITVDGSNNKWVGTASSGVFYFNSNGQETIHHFTKDNSPLPSNNIQDIAIDDSSGVVYIATTNGLVAYKGTATAPRDDLSQVYAFPNPVRPGFTGNVTINGLTENANVKITDITGNLVFETTSEGGSVLWDTTAFGRHKVASGVYLVLVSTEDLLETTVTKIMIIR